MTNIEVFLSRIRLSKNLFFSARAICYKTLRIALEKINKNVWNVDELGKLENMDTNKQ